MVMLLLFRDRVMDRGESGVRVLIRVIVIGTVSIRVAVGVRGRG